MRGREEGDSSIRYGDVEWGSGSFVGPQTDNDTNSQVIFDRRKKTSYIMMTVPESFSFDETMLKFYRWDRILQVGPINR